MTMARSFGTHDGTFHADEVTACALLLLFNLIDRDKIFRTRDEEVLSKCEYVCDVGGQYTPDKKRFDHHQIEYQGELSSAGMVWLDFLRKGLIDEQIYDFFNRSLILGIDAHDIGRAIFQEGVGTFSHIIANFVPPTHDADPELIQKAFNEALDFALGHLRRLLEGVLEMRQYMNHPLLNKETPIALITGGGPGVMEVGNRVAKKLGILSCANIVDFNQGKQFVHEQRQNQYIDAKMTYRLDKLVERQAEFNLDFPIFLIGGIGTDFEYSLEEVRRKVGSTLSNPILLFGSSDYWRQKVTGRFQCNMKEGTIKGSEWVSNCFYCVQTASQGLKVYQQFFDGSLAIGRNGPTYKEGFVSL